MEKILQHDNDEITAAARTCQVVAPTLTPTEHPIVCHALSQETNATTQVTPSQPTARRAGPHMATIEETDENHTPHINRRPLAELEMKLSNASCHKRSRGLTTRINKAHTLADVQQQLRGLQRCQLQHDTGASHNITPDRAILLDYQPIPSMDINGVEKESPALTAIGTGKLPITSDEGDILTIECLYTPKAACTLLSPTAMCRQYSTVYTGFKTVANTSNNTGYLQLIHTDGVNHSTFGLFSEGNLWWHYAHKVGATTTAPVV